MARLLLTSLAGPIGEGRDVQTPTADRRQGVGLGPSGRFGFNIEVMVLFMPGSDRQSTEAYRPPRPEDERLLVQIVA
jgi:hypothetical protein